MTEPISLKSLGEFVQKMQAAEREAEKLYGPWRGFCPGAYRCQHLRLITQVEDLLASRMPAEGGAHD